MRSSDPVTPEEVFAYWREPWEMWWAEQPFTVTPEYVARWIERKFSPTGPSANAFRHLTASPDYTIMSRIEMSAASLIAELRATNHWGSITAEYFEGAAPSPRWASSSTRSSRTVRWRAAMPDWRAWPFPTEDPYPAYHAAREQAPVQWNEPLGAHLVLSHEHAAAVLRSPEWSSDPRNSPQMLASLGGPGPVSEQWSRSLLMSDPPTHTRLRSGRQPLLHATSGAGESAGASPRSSRARSQRSPTASQIELMSELAYPIPLAVIAELFDIGLEGAELLALRDSDARADARARPDTRRDRGDRHGRDDGDVVPRPDRRRSGEKIQERTC